MKISKLLNALNLLADHFKFLTSVYRVAICHRGICQCACIMSQKDLFCDCPVSGIVDQFEKLVALQNYQEWIIASSTPQNLPKKQKCGKILTCSEGITTHMYFR